MVGIDVGRMLRAPGRRGPVPMQHLVQDFNGDGEFDNYFHLKAMTIVGNVGGDRTNYVLLNGSSNWSGLGTGQRREPRHLLAQGPDAAATRSTSTTGTTHFPAATDRPPRRRPRPAAATDDQLVVRHGDGRRLRDGTPINGVDPYANVDLD